MTRHPPALVTCMMAIALFDGCARLFGLRRAFRLAALLAPAVPAGSPVPSLVAETARRVAVAGAFHPRRALCLEQSLALFVLLRRRRVAAELRLGVQPRPFHAHAWVEVGGEAVNESADLVAAYAVFSIPGV
jgi:hypothetical protein